MIFQLHRSLHFFLPLALAFVLALSFVSHAAPVTKITTEYYDISGTTAEALRSQMNQRGVLWQDKRYDGRTHWEIHWNYRYEFNGRTCYFTSHTVTTKITVTLPRWTNRASASPTLQQRWTRFLNVLKAHENNHVRYSLQAAENVAEMLDSLAPQATCDALENIANTRGQAILQANRERNAEYDRRTNHGATEGVRFP